MLLAFRVTNHKSIRDEAEFSLARKPRIASRASVAGRPVDLPSPVAAIYGANASGKSNLLDALAFMATAVRDSYGRWAMDAPIPIAPFALDQVHGDGPSTFEVDLLLDRVRYQYGFVLDRERVREEWLYAYPHRRRQTWFERDCSGEEQFYFGTLLGGQKQVLAELTRPNALFLSVAASTGHDQMGPVAGWFGQRLGVARPTNEEHRVREAVYDIALSPQLSDRVLDVLRYADLGISGVQIELVDSGMKGLGQHSFLVASPEFREWFVRAAAEESDLPGSTDAIHDGRNLRSTGGGQRSKRGARTVDFTLRLQHSISDGEPVPLPFESESRGTRALMALAVPALQALEHGSTLLVDELDTSLHPKLVREFVRLFQDYSTNPRNAQLVFTSHDTSLLGNLASDDPLLERDQVWLTDKDGGGATHLYPLTDFSPRTQENLERGYLQGRYGAVPYFDQDELSSLRAEGQ